jgi:hypothetical protein
MAKTNEEILEAVQALDPQNDEHWTADGLPRLDAVENLLGSDISRKVVTNAAPDFSRAVAQELAQSSDNGEPLADEPLAQGPTGTISTGSDNGAEPASLESSGPAGQAAVAADKDDDSCDPLAEGPADLEAELDDEIRAVQERLEAIRENLEEGRRLLLETEEDLSRLRDEKDRQFPPMSPAEAIQRFQRSELAKRAATRGVAGPSPLDSALRSARKVRRQGATGDGTQKAG